MGDFKADLGSIMVIVVGDEELRWMRNVNCITHRLCLCVYVHVWISGFFVLVYWHPGLFVPACFVSLLEVFHHVREIRRA